VLNSISRLDLEIALSRIATEKGAAIDTFYLTDKSGEKVISDESLRTLRDAILEAIELLKPAPPSR
jgi:[protein-PII] uridylyltransferase